jgi:hypothetical protein
MDKDEALRLALEKVANALPAYIEGTPAREYLAVIHSALAAPVQEPVATGKQFLQVEQLLNDMLDTLPYNTPEYWIGRIKEVVPLYTAPPAQPAVPDAFGTREGEHPQYIQGWNDCRAEMLKGNTP